AGAQSVPRHAGPKAAHLTDRRPPGIHISWTGGSSLRGGRSRVARKLPGAGSGQPLQVGQEVARVDAVDRDGASGEVVRVAGRDRGYRLATLEVHQLGSA